MHFLAALTFRSTPLRIFRRTYALSRFASRPTATSRSRNVPQKRVTDFTRPKRFQNMPREEEASEDVSKLWHTSQRPPTSDPQEGLHALLMRQNILFIERQIEMLNIFIGFEQCNKYIITNEAGETVGYVAEESNSFLSVVTRQAFATHRPFRAVIMDTSGSPVLWLRRPFSWINSRMYVQRSQDSHGYTEEGQLLDTFGVVQQIWHPWRRRYEVFLRQNPRRILTLAHETQPEPEPEVIYTQFSKVDAGPLAWNFPLYDNPGREIGYISREFRGFGREIFTDTGKYTVGFVQGVYAEAGYGPSQASHQNLSIDERAVILALAVNIDFDYFSRHSHVGGGGFFHLDSWE